MRRERPERAASPQPRATPWVPGYKALRPVRAKVWAHLLFITFALTGRRCGEHGTQGVALGSELVGLSARAGPPICPELRRNSINSNRRARAARQFVNSLNSLLRRLRPTNELRRSPQPRCKNSINSNLRRERPERAATPQTRATPWVSAYKRLRPVRAKVWANG